MIQKIKNELEPLVNGVTADRELTEIISQQLNRAGIYYRIFSRIKSAQSTAAKLYHKEEKYQNRGKGMQDIIGVRVVLYYYDDVLVCKNILANTFKLLPEDSEEDIPEAADFSPIRRNLVFVIPDEILDMISSDLWKNYRIEKTFEVQLRTIFSEGWYEIEHDVRYKHKKEWENKEYYKYHRGLNSINAALEICDHEIVRHLEDLAYTCYKKKDVQQMLRYKLRIHLEKEDISETLVQEIERTKGFLKELFRMDRGKVLCCISHPQMGFFPKTLDNIIFLCNELYIKEKNIKELVNPVLLNKIENGLKAL